MNIFVTTKLLQILKVPSARRKKTMKHVAIQMSSSFACLVLRNAAPAVVNGLVPMELLMNIFVTVVSLQILKVPSALAVIPKKSLVRMEIHFVRMERRVVPTVIGRAASVMVNLRAETVKHPFPIQMARFALTSLLRLRSAAIRATNQGFWTIQSEKKATLAVPMARGD